MYTLFCALAAALLVGLVVGFGISAWAAILPALIVGVVVYFVMMRRLNGQVQGAMAEVGKLFQDRKIDEATVVLQRIQQRYGKWTFFLGSQLDGQIGAIHYMKKEFAKARPYLERSFFRSWDAKMMLGVLASGIHDNKKKETPHLAAADAVFEAAVKHTPKQGLLWSTWAWLHHHSGNVDKARDILTRGKTALGDTDAVLTQNLLALQNDKKLKMKGYGDAWYALHLETHPMLMQQQRGPQMRFGRR
jgi:tetratricopeptide (TPR) repeat protein